MPIPGNSSGLGCQVLLIIVRLWSVSVTCVNAAFLAIFFGLFLSILSFLVAAFWHIGLGLCLDVVFFSFCTFFCCLF